MQQERAKELFGELVYDAPLHSPGIFEVSVSWCLLHHDVGALGVMPDRERELRMESLSMRFMQTGPSFREITRPGP